MIQTFYSSICENAVRGVTSAGLPVIVVPKPGFSKKVAYFATACGMPPTIMYCRKQSNALR